MIKMTTLEQYQEVEYSFYRNLTKRLSNKISLYCVVGSLAFKNIIPNWSDIDLLLVVKDYSKKVFDSLKSTNEQNTSGISIGFTFYSEREFSSPGYKDTKTLIALQQIKLGIYQPRFLDVNLRMPEISDEEIAKQALGSFPRNLHDFKRELVVLEVETEKQAYKRLIILLKIMLLQKGVKVFGYDLVLKAARKYLPGFIVSLPTPAEILLMPNKWQERRSVYCSFLEWLKTYDYTKTGI